MAYRFRLEPSAEQEQVLSAHCQDARFVWNLALEQMGSWRPGQPSVDMSAWDQQLAEATEAGLCHDRRPTLLGHG